MIFRRLHRNPILIDGEQSTIIRMSYNRLSMVSFFFIVGYVVLLLRLLDLSIVQGTIHAEPVDDHVRVSQIAPRRGDVYDRHGFLLATTLKTPSLYVDPALVIEPGALLTRVMDVFPDANADVVLRTLQAKNRFGWIKRNITPQQQREVMEIGSPALGFEYEYKRVYPQGNLFAHFLGYADRDGLGLSGVELSYDDVLGRGDDVHLALDLRLQHVVKREVMRTIEAFNAKAGVGIVMDSHTGEVLAGVSLPDFDLNLAGKARDHQKFNRMTVGVYELGSMFKIFSTAALLDLHNVPLSMTFDARKPLKIGRHRINDFHAQKRILTVPEVFMHSSNIGSALMGRMIGGQALKAFYADLGLIHPMLFDFKEVGKPIVPNPWREANTLTASYGHGLATTPLQMSAAVATVVNDGLLVTPTLSKHDADAIKSDVRVMSSDTSEKMRRLLRLVVTQGTAKKADVQGYAVGGKTGTAEKSVNGRYDRDLLISSFVGAFPMHDPRYVVMVMIDEPKGNADSHGYATAGWVAAPTINRIVRGMVGVLGIPAVSHNGENDISEPLMRYVHDPKKKGGRHLVSY